MGLCETKPVPAARLPPGVAVAARLPPGVAVAAAAPAPAPALLSSMSIVDMPFEILVPFLKVEDIGALSMVNKDLNESCGDNLVWRDLYRRTLADTRTCKNRKSYKITVLSKMNTQAKKPLRKTQERLDRSQGRVKDWKSCKERWEESWRDESGNLSAGDRMWLVDWGERLRAEEAELTQTLTVATAKSARLNQAVQSLKAEAQKAIDDKTVAKKAEKEAKKKKPKKKAVKKTKN